MRARRAIAALTRLLDEERRCLVSGNFKALAGLVSKKDTAVAALDLSETGIAADEIQLLKLEANRNAKLLEAALTGLQEAQARLETLRRGVPCGTYGADGRRHEIITRAPTLTKRA